MIFSVWYSSPIDSVELDRYYIDMPEMLFWDCDGTIVNSGPYYFAATGQILTECGIQVPQNFFEVQYMQNHRSAFDYARSRGMDEQTIQILKKKRNVLYEDMLQGDIPLMDGAMETLTSLSKSYRMAMVSNSRRKHLDQILDRCLLRPLFEFTLASEDFAKEKPAPDPYITALQRSGLAPGECIAIEDSVFGIQSATRAGLFCIAIHKTMDESKTPAHKVIRTIRELSVFLLEDLVSYKPQK